MRAARPRDARTSVALQGTARERRWSPRIRAARPCRRRSARRARRTCRPLRCVLDAPAVVKPADVRRARHASRTVTTPVFPSTRTLLAVPDLLGPEPGPDHCGQPVLARDDRGVGHDPADVRDRALDPREHGRPARRGDRTHQNLAGAHSGRAGRPTVITRAGPSATPGRGREAAQLALAVRRLLA